MKILLLLTLLFNSFSMEDITLGDSEEVAGKKLNSKGYIRNLLGEYTREKETLILSLWRHKVASIFYRNEDGGKSYDLLSKVYNTKKLALNCKRKERMYISKNRGLSTIFITVAIKGDCINVGKVKSYKMY